MLIFFGREVKPAFSWSFLGDANGSLHTISKSRKQMMTRIQIQATAILQNSTGYQKMLESSPNPQSRILFDESFVLVEIYHVNVHYVSLTYNRS